MQDELMKLQIRQLIRLLETKRVKFHTAFYVIFSDYPSQNVLIKILQNCEDDPALYNKIASELHSLVMEKAAYKINYEK